MKSRLTFILFAIAILVFAFPASEYFRERSKSERICEVHNGELLALKKKDISLSNDLKEANNKLPYRDWPFGSNSRSFRAMNVVDQTSNETLAGSRNVLADFARRATAAMEEIAEHGIGDVEEGGGGFFDFETQDRIDAILDRRSLRSAPDLKLGRPSLYSIGELFRKSGGAQLYIDSLNTDIQSIDEVIESNNRIAEVNRQIQTIESEIDLVQQKRRERIDAIERLPTNRACRDVTENRLVSERTLDFIQQLLGDPDIIRGAKVAIPEYEKIIRDNQCKDVDTISATLWGGTGIGGPGDHRVPIRNIYIERIQEYSAKIGEIRSPQYDVTVAMETLCNQIVAEAESIAYVFRCVDVSGWEDSSLSKFASNCLADNASGSQRE